MASTFSYQVKTKSGKTITRTVSKRKTKSGRTISTVEGGLNGKVRLSSKDGLTSKQSIDDSGSVKLTAAEPTATEMQPTPTSPSSSIARETALKPWRSINEQQGRVLATQKPVASQQEPYFGEPGTIQKQPSRLKEKLETSTGGQVILQAGELGGDLLRGSLETSPVPKFVGAGIEARKKGKKFKATVKEREKRFSRETTTFAITAGAAAGLAAAPVAVVASPYFTGGLVAADVALTTPSVVRAVKNPTPATKGEAILTAGLSVAGTLAATKAARAEKAAKALKGKEFSAAQIKERAVGLEVQARPQVGAGYIIEQTRTPVGTFGRGSATPFYGEPELLKASDIVSPNLVTELRSGERFTQPLGGRQGVSAELATTTRFQTARVIPSEQAITQPRQALQLTDIPSGASRAREEGFIRYVTVDTPSSSARGAYKANEAAIKRLSQSSPTIEDKALKTKALTYNPSGAYDYGVVSVKTDQGVIKLAIDKATGALRGEVKSVAPVFKVESARSPTELRAGKVVTASQVIKKRQPQTDTSSSFSGDFGTQTILETPEVQSTGQFAIQDPILKKKQKQKFQQQYQQEYEQIGAYTESQRSQLKDALYGQVTGRAQTVPQAPVLKQGMLLKADTLVLSKTQEKALLPGLKTPTRTLPDTMGKLQIEQVAKAIADTATKPALAVDQQLKLNTETKLSTDTVSRYRLRPDTPLRPDSLFKKFRKLDFDKNKKKSSFGILVRRQGEFSQIGVSQSLKGAFAKGASKVGSSAAASFKIVDLRTGKAVNAPSIGKDFYQSKREAGVFIERRERRIKSRGELQDITFKGIASKRKGKIRF